MKIESHAHGYPGENRLPENYVRKCRERGIDRIALIESSEHLFPVFEQFPDFVIPIPFVDIDSVTPDKIDSLFACGARGIKFIGPSHSYGDESYYPLYEQVRSHNGLAIFHTGFMGVGYFEKGCCWEKSSPIDISNMRPAAIDRVARAVPNLKILMAHFGNPWWEEAWKIMTSHKNVFADLSGGTAFRRSLNMWEEIFAPNGILDEYALSRLCFGSDTHYFQQDNYAFEKYISFYDCLFERIKAPQSLRDAVNRGNLLSALGE